MRAQQHVAHLRVQKAVQQHAAVVEAAAQTGADGVVDQAVQALARAHLHLAQRRAVDVRIKAHGHAQRVHEPAAHGHVLPAGLGGVGDVAVGRGILVEIHGAEAAHAQRLDALVGKKADDVREGRLRVPRGVTLARKDLAFFIAQGTDHLRSASFQSSQQHGRPLLLCSCYYDILFRAIRQPGNARNAGTALKKTPLMREATLQGLALGLKIRALMRPKKMAAAMPDAARVTPPASAPRMP